MAVSTTFGELDEAPLDRSPIVSVVWQLRFEDHPALIAPETVLRLHEQLGGTAEFNLMSLPSVKVSLQAVGSATNEQPNSFSSSAGGWRLIAVDGLWQVTVAATALSVESTVYGTWLNGFQPHVNRVLQALAEIGSPVIETRLGLRFTNIVVGGTVGKAPLSRGSQLAGIVADWLLGPLAGGHLSDSVEASRGRTIFNLGAVKSIVNHGIVTTESRELGYLLDIDTFREGGRALRIDEIVAESDRLHVEALGIFQASLTPDALKAMGTSSPANPDGAR